MPRRLYLALFKPLVFDDEIRPSVVLMGPRRVGKTVMLYHTIAELIKSGVPPQKIIFITVKNPIYKNIGLETLFDYAKEAIAGTDKVGWYVFYNEIHYLKIGRYI